MGILYPELRVHSKFVPPPLNVRRVPGPHTTHIRRRAGPGRARPGDAVSLFKRHFVTLPFCLYTLSVQPQRPTTARTSLSASGNGVKSLRCVGLDGLSPAPPGVLHCTPPARPRSACFPAAATGGGTPVGGDPRPRPGPADRRSGRCHVLGRLMVQFRNNFRRPSATAHPSKSTLSAVACRPTADHV